MPPWYHANYIVLGPDTFYWKGYIMTSKNTDNGIMMVIYDVILDFPSFTGVGALWKQDPDGKWYKSLGFSSL